jgi:hypothetical protein
MLETPACRNELKQSCECFTFDVSAAPATPGFSLLLLNAENSFCQPVSGARAAGVAGAGVFSGGDAGAWS